MVGGEIPSHDAPSPSSLIGMKHPLAHHSTWDRRVKNLLLPCLLLLFVLPGCGPNERRVGHEVLNTVTDVADPTYQLAVDGCDAARDAIIARQGTSYAEDRSAMDQIHEVCDGIVAGFESLRGTQLTARAALDGGLAAAAATAIQQALALWGRLQALVPQIQQLGTSGGESP